MKYFAKFIVLSLCITVLTGYEALAQQKTIDCVYNLYEDIGFFVINIEYENAH